MEMIFELKEIQSVAREIWKQVNNKKVIAFYGEMGSGKTTLISALCVEKNVKGAVSSPTFSIINEYESSAGVIFHLDLYRLNSIQEVIQAGVEDCLYSGNICLVEWPEKAASLLPDDSVFLRLDVINEETRRIRIKDN